METQAGEWERVEERKSRSDMVSIEEMFTHVAFLVTVHFPGVSTCGNIRFDYGVQVTGDASYFSHLGSLCSSEPSGGLLFVAMDTVDGNSLGKSTPPQGRGVKTKTLEGSQVDAPATFSSQPLTAAAPSCITSSALSLASCTLPAAPGLVGLVVDFPRKTQGAERPATSSLASCF